MNPHHFGNLDTYPHHFSNLDPHPHQSDKLDPDPQQFADDKPKSMEYDIYFSTFLK